MVSFLIFAIVLLLTQNNKVTEATEKEEVCTPFLSRDYKCGYSDDRYGYAFAASNIESHESDYIKKSIAKEVSTDEFAPFYATSRGVVGGKLASHIRGYYMAQIGERRGEKINWLCDGVLINRQWVLSAAHCFAFPDVNPNLIRLGDYNLSEPVGNGSDPFGKYIEDHPIEEVILHPEFKFEERYHDLVLLKIPRKTNYYAYSINPICLPWGFHADSDLVGSKVVLTGWGAQNYGGLKVDALQEVELKVFNVSVCNNAYSKRPESRTKYPLGLTEENTLCVGWEEDGKDACKGDSGGPITYQEDVFDGRFFLAGIVSGGYGCGQKEYPGLYIPINRPKYLRWIRDTAFQEHIPFEKEEACTPNLKENYECSHLRLPARIKGYLHNGSVVSPYHFNKSAEEFALKGFKIRDQNINSDFAFNFTYYNDTYSETIGFNRTLYDTEYLQFEGPSSVYRALYMAQIGKKVDDKISWLCEGALINKQWVLTAAQCFTLPNENPNIIRLGEHDKSKLVQKEGEYSSFYIDNTIEKIIIHRDFKKGQIYHDLALLKIPREIPEYLGSVVPICLFWDYRSNINLVGNNSILIGWGLTNFSEPNSETLQEINLKVFNTSFCNRTYAALPDSSPKYPNGISDENFLCAGWEVDEKNICKQGKPGSPLVYRNYLAGIFSFGNRCGLKEYPGIYIPIHKPKYLRWIREIAFQ